MDDAFTSSRRGHGRGGFRGCACLDIHVHELLDARFCLTLWKTSIDIHIDKLLEMLSSNSGAGANAAQCKDSDKKKKTQLGRNLSCAN